MLLPSGRRLSRRRWVRSGFGDIELGSLVCEAIGLTGLLRNRTERSNLSFAEGSGVGLKSVAKRFGLTAAGLVRHEFGSPQARKHQVCLRISNDTPFAFHKHPLNHHASHTSCQIATKSNLREEFGIVGPTRTGHL